MPRLPRPRYADVTATLALVIALGTGGAYAATSLVSTGQIANGAVTTAKIHNNAVTSAKLAPAVRSTLNRYTFAPWKPLPHHQMVSGVFFDTGRSGSSATDVVANVQLPAPSLSPISDSNIAFGTIVGGTTKDSRCTGSYSNPTAPAGLVCIYLSYAGGFSGANAYGWIDTALQHRAFYVDFTQSGADTNYDYYGSWAYTAP